ncbi:PfkB family carbohydrate kinase [Bacillus sp. B-jedd]|uniref:PfkB family carbohydrate kinase n=1 Tax=Bacillus sp. B-jedd TaxID=1476857 RepID=UPI0005155F01|nr:PfkB family carbohydrate kinase [Bacillus sp. B-jedd]CEG26380.1 pfkB family carbohydrate kinase [Bacillus sp. B-jedd]
MKYIIVGPTIVNDIQFADGTTSKGHIGGAIFCLEGLKIWSDDCLYVSNVGEDFSNYYGEWMDKNHCSYEGLNYILPRTEYTTLVYGDEGLHDEVSIYSEDIDKQISALDKRTAEQIASYCSDETKGIYIEASESDPLWDNLHLIQMKCNAKIMWEIPTSAAMEKNRKEKVLKTIHKAGLYSINFPEAMSLFEKEDEKSAVDAIIAFGVPCFFRVGSKGSYMISDGQAYFAPSITIGDIVDATGCGNCSTAAALYAYCEGFQPEKIAAMANVAAAYNLVQYGPYPVITNETRTEALQLVEKLIGKFV